MKEKELVPTNFWFHDTVSALAYSFAATDPSFQPPFNDLTEFILEQYSQMPDYLRGPMLAAAFGFDSAGFLNGCKPFHRQPRDIRQKQIASWKNSHSSFKRDFIRYFESLATFALFSRDPAENISGQSMVSGKNVIENRAGPLRAETVVVGSGPGGAITACLLAEAGRDVLLVEEGSYYTQGSCTPFSKNEMLRKYRRGGQTVAFGKNKIGYVEGCCVGGGSEINSGLYHRTPPEILERWREEFQVDGLSEKEMQPHFEAGERDVSVSNLPCPAPAASLKLHDGALQLGWKSLEVPRWFRYAPENIVSPKGTRQSMTEIFLPRFLRAGGRLLPRTRIHRFHREGGGWILQTTPDLQGARRISAGAIFLCAGAVQTPALLRRSGVTANIGNSLQVHPTVKIVAKFPEAVNAPDMGVPVHQVKEFAPRLSFGCSISSPAHLALGLLDHPAATRGIARDWKHMAIYYAMITSEGCGTVRTLPGFEDPLVRYKLSKGDRLNLADGLKKLGQILFETGASVLYPGISNGQKLLRREDSAKLPEVIADGRANLMTIHLFSSCPMGEDRNKCAADSFGRVHGFKNLFINDASLLCTAPGVNPQGSIMALARRNVLRYLAV
jgi:choline dehydrogenase-like flavoprotein